VRHPFRRKNLSPSLLPFYALAALGLALARPTPLGFAVGGALVAAGEGLRLWGAGHLVKTRALTVTGPYAHHRHPLYAGTLLLALGFGAIAGGVGLALVAGAFLPVFFLHYLPYKERVESARLASHWGDAYLAYRSAVPALIPRLRPWDPPPGLGLDGARRWSRARCRENDEFGALLGVAVGVALLALRPAL
jgi:protein-S-isoprenylcysteine O-methyltransferase Ste14